MIDENSRNTWVILLEHKSDSFDALQTFITLAHTQFVKKVKIVRLDNALEFENFHCKSLCEVYGIIHQITCVNRAQQNGRCERKHRNVLEMARCLRMQAELPNCYWGDCALTSAYLINKLLLLFFITTLPMKPFTKQNHHNLISKPLAASPLPITQLTTMIK